MKNLILITIVTVVMSIFYSSCKKDVICVFGRATLENKTYKIKYSLDSNGINIDYRLSNMFWCVNDTYITFNSDGTYTLFPKTCKEGGWVSSTGTWRDAFSKNNKNYIAFGGTYTEVFGFNCNSFYYQIIQSKYTSTGATYYTETLTKTYNLLQN
ncbi:MAG: hypothetical protein QM539_10030 [Alphaproteobacteria bacterium]|nr:hypothetical protein [Alphaproteobacteria bacterium]